MRIFPLDYSEFRFIDVLPQNEEHRNDIHVVALEGKKARWYAKKMSDHNVAVENLLSAELYRLISTHPHPGTLVAKTEDNDWYSLSEDLSETHAVVGTAELSSNPGFADVLVVSLWLHEIDLKLPNLLVNRETGAIAKIDGEYSFFSLIYHKHQHVISEETLKMLPFPHRYPTYNWLEYIRDNKSFGLREFHDPNGLPEAFEEEKNRALLRICLLPDRFIMSICKTILFKREQADFNDFLIERREQIKRSALVSHSFRAYLSSMRARSDLQSFLEDLKTFTTQGVRIIDNSRTESLENEYMAVCRELGLPDSSSAKKENHLSTYSMFASCSSSESSTAQALSQCKTIDHSRLARL